MLIVWLALFVTVVIIISTAFWVIRSGNQARKQLESVIRSLPNFTPIHLFVGEDARTGIGIDESSKKVCLAIDSGNGHLVSYSDILSCQIVEDGSTVTMASRGSQIGGAIVGTLLFGGVGAIIGGLSGKTTQHHEVSRIDLELIINNTRYPRHVVNFLDIKTGKDSILYKAAIEKARNWYALVEVIIKQGDAKGKISEQDSIPLIPDQATTITPELNELVQLRNNGVLSQQEFEVERNKLLNKRSNR